MAADKELALWLIFGIVMIASGFSIEGERANIVRTKRQVQINSLWPRDIFYTISDILAKHSQPMEAISSAIAHWEARTCLRFTYIPEAELAHSGIMGRQQYISFNGSLVCNSPVGMWAGRGPHIIKISRDCSYVGMIIHELGHALGMWHEHSRSDRDAHVLIFWNNIISGDKHNFRKHSQPQLVVPYDLESIMHYDKKMFGIKDKTTLETLDRRLSHIVGRHNELSHYDSMAINLIYQCADHCDPDIVCENDGYMTSECVCECPFGLKGDRCEVVDTSEECGGVVHVADRDVVVTSPNFPAPYGNNQKCVWLLKGPPRTLLRLRVTSADMEASPIAGARCRDNLRIRYHSIGVSKGYDMCKTNHSGEIFDSVDNKIMLHFTSNYKVAGQGFHAVVSTRPQKDCSSSPCQNGGECEDVEAINTYVCTCPDKWVGKDCEIPIVDGRLSHWSEWSRCESQCGTQSRYRTCTDPAPQNGGNECTGNTYTSRRCHENPNCEGYFSCNFGSTKESTTCGIKPDLSSGSLEWILNAGKTTTQLTGPLAGHTTGDQGDFYYYMEASVGNEGDKAASWLPQRKLKANFYCLEFYYTMHGNKVGTLSVLKQFKGKPGQHTTIWQRSGEQGQEWKKGLITVLMHRNVQIGFMAIRGGSYSSDIAIDDITVSPGTCKPIGRNNYKGCKVGNKTAKRGKHFRKQKNCVINRCFCNYDGYVDCPPTEESRGCKRSKTSITSPRWRKRDDRKSIKNKVHKQRLNLLAKWGGYRKNKLD